MQKKIVIFALVILALFLFGCTSTATDKNTSLDSNKPLLNGTGIKQNTGAVKLDMSNSIVLGKKSDFLFGLDDASFSINYEAGPKDQIESNIEPGRLVEVKVKQDSKSIKIKWTQTPSEWYLNNYAAAETFAINYYSYVIGEKIGDGKILVKSMFSCTKKVFGSEPITCVKSSGFSQDALNFLHLIYDDYRVIDYKTKEYVPRKDYYYKEVSGQKFLDIEAKCLLKCSVASSEYTPTSEYYVDPCPSNVSGKMCLCPKHNGTMCFHPEKRILLYHEAPQAALSFARKYIAETLFTTDIPDSEFEAPAEIKGAK